MVDNSELIMTLTTFERVFMKQQKEGVARDVRNSRRSGTSIRSSCDTHEWPKRQNQLPNSTNSGGRSKDANTNAAEQYSDNLKGTGRDSPCKAPKVWEASLSFHDLLEAGPRERPHWRLAEARRPAFRLQLGDDGALRKQGR